MFWAACLWISCWGSTCREGRGEVRCLSYTNRRVEWVTGAKGLSTGKEMIVSTKLTCIG